MKMPGGTSRRWSELRELLFCNVLILKKAYLYFRKKPIAGARSVLQFEPNRGSRLNRFHNSKPIAEVPGPVLQFEPNWRTGASRFCNSKPIAEVRSVLQFEPNWRTGATGSAVRNRLRRSLSVFTIRTQLGPVARRARRVNSTRRAEAYATKYSVEKERRVSPDSGIAGERAARAGCGSRLLNPMGRNLRIDVTEFLSGAIPA